MTLLAILFVVELGLRLVAQAGPPAAFRVLYGNSLSMYMTVAERLRERAPEVEVLALGDSLAMTQLQPDVYAAEAGLAPERVFNAAYSGMSFPSAERLVRSIGVQRFEQLSHVIVFLNPRRVAGIENPNTDVFRVAIGDPSGPWRELWQDKKISALFDRSRLYGLSAHLTQSAWRMALVREAVWDDFTLLGPQGGVAWTGERADQTKPDYPYGAIQGVSKQRLGELRSLIEIFRERGVKVTIVPNALHPSVDPFASREVAEKFQATIARLANETGSRYLPGATRGFEPPRDTDFCDYGHMNRSGAEMLSRLWARRLRVAS